MEQEKATRHYYSKTERFPTSEEVVAQSLLDLSPELRGWALDGFNYGVIKQEDLQNNKLIEDERNRFHTSVHENAHATVARYFGWNVLVVSIIPEGNVLGFTQALPSSEKRINQLLLEKIAICFAGLAGEELIGDNDHQGCGSDFAQARFFVEVLDKFSPNHQDQFHSLIEWGKNTARSIIQDAGLDYLKQKSFSLMRSQVSTG